MSNKRQREETSEQVNLHYKRFINDNRDAKRVNPMRFENNNQQIVIPFPTDDNKDNYDNNYNGNKMINGKDNNDTEFGLLLYELASLNVAKNELQNRQMQTCPICSIRVSLSDFADHVHICLDKMDDDYRNYIRIQIQKDSDFANEYAVNHGYVKEYGTKCPICNKALYLGCGMNEHINRCADKQEMKDYDYDEDDDDDDDDINNNIKPLNREQMIQCAAKLMTLQQGTQQFDSMLDMFGALGFNK
eukprot:523550_1